MLNCVFIGKEYFLLLLLVGVVAACPVALHEGIEGLLEVGVDHYLLQFGNDGVEPQVIWVFVFG